MAHPKGWCDSSQGNTLRWAKRLRREGDTVAIQGTSGVVGWIIPLVKVTIVSLLVLGGGISFPFSGTDIESLLTTLETFAAILCLWWPGVGAMISVPMLVIAPHYAHFGLGLVAMGFTAVMAAIRWRPRGVVALAAIHLSFVLYDGVIVRLPIRTMAMVAALAICYAVGLWIRTWLGNQALGDNQIEALSRRAARAREEERTALAGELASLLVRNLNDTTRALERAGRDPDPESARHILTRVGDESRSALARLRLLVTTLRAPANATDAVSLAAAVEWFEDELVSHGFEVEIEGQNDIGSRDVASVVSGFLRMGAEAVVASAPAGAVCTLEVDAGAPLTLSLTCVDLSPDDLHRAGRVEEQAAAAGGSLEVDDGQGMTAVLTLGDAVVEAPRRRHPFASLGQDQQVLGVLSTAGAVLAALVLGFNLFNGNDWTGDLQWLVVCLGILVAVWRPWLGSLILLFEVAVLSYLMPGETFWAFTQPTVAASALTIIVVSKLPLTLPLVIGGWMVLVETTTWPSELRLIDTIPLALPSVLGGIGVYFFRTVRLRQLAEVSRLARERDEARMEERRQLASELHDIVAHQLSLIAMHLTPAAMEPHRISSTVAQLSRTTKSARNDLSTLVHSLRSGQSSDTGAMTITATTHAVTATLEEAGHPVRLSVDPEIDRLDATSQKTLSRIVREAATNAMRYSPKGSPVDIVLGVADDGARLKVTNQLRTQARVDPNSTGSGLLGLRERVELTNGSFTAGEVDAHWVVEAHVPSSDVTLST